MDENTVETVIGIMRGKSRKERLNGMEKYGISVGSALGLTIPELREIARQIGTDHSLAAGLWSTGIHEARILASIIDDPAKVTASQMDRWASDFDSWDLCDQCCGNLFCRTQFAYEKAEKWSGDGREFVKRAGFALIAFLAVHDKRSGDETFIGLLNLIERESNDSRKYVRKSVNWALRQIGKRSFTLNKAAIELARRLQTKDSGSARWIAADAIRELESEEVGKRLRNRNSKRGRTQRQ